MRALVTTAAVAVFVAKAEDIHNSMRVDVDHGLVTNVSETTAVRRRQVHPSEPELLQRTSTALWPAPTKGMPVYWFGSNLKAFDTAEYLANMTSRFDLAIYGSSHAALAPPRYQQQSQKLSTQCARLKTASSATRCAVYRQGWLAMSNYDEEMAVMNATDTTDWFLKDDTGQQWGRPWCTGPKTKCAVQGLYWNFANASAAAYYQQKVIKPITLDPSIDAVFFDDLPGVCCNSEHTLPSHYSTVQAKAMCDATLDNFNAVAKILSDAGKLPIYSLFQKPWRPCLYDHLTILERLGRGGISFARFANTIVDRGSPRGFGGSCAQMVEDALADAANGLSYMQWEDLRTDGVHNSRVGLDMLMNMSEALFLLVRAPGTWSYFGSSTGWGETSWAWHASYDRLKGIGGPVGNATRMGGGHWLREYQHATVRLFCPPDGSNENATGSVTMRS